MLQNKNPLISIVIPTYKRGEKLQRAIDSVINQTYTNWEVLVVDDNNPDTKDRKETEKLIEFYKSDNRIKYLKQVRNSGGAVARNTGIKNSEGELIAFLDDDDQFLPEKLEKQVQFLNENKNFQGVYCGSIWHGQKVIPCLSGDLRKELLQLKTSIFTPTMMFYKSVLLMLEGFDENFKRHQDYELLLRFFSKNYEIGVLSESLVIIGTNSGENVLRGKDLENLKRNFLQQFSSIIEEIEKKRTGFSKRNPL
ncbi:glycosyltransferase [Antarcticibacterium sp. 1MA-6-2]|uniref:glycosyltransferase family 2 protein n=1 Tax=Antarcticibacterium sp. 1MA-6-2 TaxID=2908210 RepID=UPI001F3C9309|nr:glycosyltransferase family 2 protein [Antarcticibacterium sp. 1MA-6-2]UJH89868.1 glycosyltransferase [Antarcticibacterium sp. 1MA-6-2]